MTIKCVDDVLGYLYNLDSMSGGLCFRGQAKFEWDLRPSIHLTGLKRYQTVIAESFLLYCLQDPQIKLPHVYTGHPIEQLMMCQHYRIPTRLLDWSNDILVSLFFACEKHKNRDGALYICDRSAYEKLDLNKFRRATIEPLIVDTHIVNPRLRAQSGLFMLWGAKALGSETSETYSLEEYNSARVEGEPVKKLLVKKQDKDSILEELSSKYGINNDSVYLSTEFGAHVKFEYTKFKKISDKIMSGITGDKAGDPYLIGQVMNFAGCVNLEAFAEHPPLGFSNWLNNILKEQTG